MSDGSVVLPELVLQGLPYIGQTFALTPESLTALNDFLADKEDVSFEWYSRYTDNSGRDRIFNFADPSNYYSPYELSRDQIFSPFDLTDPSARFFLSVSYTDPLAEDPFAIQTLVNAEPIVVTNGNAPASATARFVELDTEGQTTVIDTFLQGKEIGLENLQINDLNGIAPNAVIEYSWLRGATDIPGATQSSYVLTREDVGQTISLKLLYTDEHGFFERAFIVGHRVESNPVESVIVSGLPQQGVVLDALVYFNPGSGDETLTYQWYRVTESGDELIEGATARTFTPTQNEVGLTLRVAISVEGGGTVLSTPTNEIANVNDAPDVAFFFTASDLEAPEYSEQNQRWEFPDDTVEGGRTVMVGVGSTLTAFIDRLIDPDGNGNGEFSYQWLRNGEPIDGAVQSSYQLSHDDMYYNVSLQLSYVDGYGTVEMFESDAVTVEGQAEKEVKNAITTSQSTLENMTLSQVALAAESSAYVQAGQYSYNLFNDSTLSWSAGVGFVAQTINQGSVSDFIQLLEQADGLDNSLKTLVADTASQLVQHDVRFLQFSFSEQRAEDQPVEIKLSSTHPQPGLVIDASALPPQSKITLEQAPLVVLQGDHVQIDVVGNSEIIATDGSVQVTGSAGEFLLRLGSGSHEIQLAEGDDVIHLAGGGGEINSGTGFDSLVLDGQLTDYELQQIVDGWEIIHADGVYSLQNVNMLYTEDGVKTLTENPWMDQLIQENWVMF